jgi:hypothetical protein
MASVASPRVVLARDRNPLSLVDQRNAESLIGMTPRLVCQYYVSFAWLRALSKQPLGLEPSPSNRLERGSG